MPTLEGLNLSISADVKDLLKGLADGKKSIQDFADTGEASLETLGDAYKVLQKKQQQATNPSDIKRYTSALKEIDGARKGLTTLATTDLPKLSNASNVAGQSLINLGRIAQDAPFGFIGIQNNINPLLESFQRLKVETGSNKEAFKTLASSLIGPAGLGVAVSVITGILTVLTQNGFFKSAAGADKAAEALKKHKEAIEEDKKAIDGIFASTAREVVNVQSIVAVLNSEVATRARKLDALKELQKIQPDIFKGVKLEGDAVIGLNAAYAAYLAQIKTVIAVKIKQQQLEKVTEDILKREGITLTEQEKLFKSTGAGIRKSLEDKAQVADRGNKLTLKRVGEEQKAQRELDADYKEQAILLKAIADLQAGIKIPDQKDRVKKVKTVVEILGELRAELKLIDASELVFGTDESEKKIQQIRSAIESLTKIGIKPNNNIIQSLFAGVDSKTVQKFLQDEVLNNIKDLNLNILGKKISQEAKIAFGELSVESGKALDDLSNKFKDITLKIKLKPDLSENDVDATKLKIKAQDLGLSRLIPPNLFTSPEAQAALAKNISDAKSMIENYKRSIIGLTSGVGEVIGKSLGEAFSGGNFGESLGKGIFLLIGNFITDFGKQMLAIGALGKIVKGALKAAFSNPILAIGAGIAAIALGTAITNAANSKPKGFATGGLVNGRGTKTSDSIPANLSRGEFVIKAAAVDKFGIGFLNNINNLRTPQMPSSHVNGNNLTPISGSDPIVMIAQSTIRGADIVTSFKRASATNGRNS